MTATAVPDWGDPPFTPPANDAAQRETFRLADTVLDGSGGMWPDPGAPARPTPLEEARGALIDRPGTVRRLGWQFRDEEAATELAARFADVDPADLDPDADGYLEAVAVRDPDGGCWRVLARYVSPSQALYPDFQTWMIEWLTPTIHRPLRAGVMWCPQWWRHPEAVARLDALWHAWEAARTEGGAAMAYWWEMHFDAHWAALTSERGPFANCKDRVHAPTDKQLDTLPFDPPPENWPWPSDKDPL